MQSSEPVRRAEVEGAGDGNSGSDPARQAAVPGRANVPAPPESFGRGELDKNGQRREQKPPLFKRPIFWAVIAIVAIGGTVAAVLWFLNTRGKISTDDAFIAAHVTNVGPRIAGYVQKVLVNDNQIVHAGDLLVELDKKDLQQALESAQAQQSTARGQVQQAEAQVGVAQAQLVQSKADITAAQSSSTQAEEDLKRYQSADRRAVSQQQLDASLAAVRTSHANLEAAQAKQTAAEAQVNLASSQVESAKDQLRRADVAVEQATTQLGYTTIAAPQDGQITNRSVSVGDWVQIGQPLMALVPNEVYVIANFKETELKQIRPGQKATVSIDAYRIKLNGHVEGIQAGSGAAFSLLPPENATGNYVKIVQRVPVKIVLDEQPPQRLGPGMSVVPTIYIRESDK